MFIVTLQGTSYKSHHVGVNAAGAERLVTADAPRNRDQAPRQRTIRDNDSGTQQRRSSTARTAADSNEDANSERVPERNNTRVPEFMYPTQSAYADDAIRYRWPILGVSADRPAVLHVPRAATAAEPLPLFILLHGIGNTGAGMEYYARFWPELKGSQSSATRALFISPDGLPDRMRGRFWRTDMKCGEYVTPKRRRDGEFGRADAAYIISLIEEAATIYNVDRRRIYTIGFSNGAFMAFRMALQYRDVFAAIAPVGGTTDKSAFDRYANVTSPAASLLNIHATVDTIVSFDGKKGRRGYYGAEKVCELYAHKAIGCNAGPLKKVSSVLQPGPSLQSGVGTTVYRASGCPSDSAKVEHWVGVGGNHGFFPWASSAPGSVVKWLMDHPKPQL